MNPLEWVDGYKTILAAIGLVGLAAYQFSQGQYDQAAQTFLAALGLFGLRHAAAKLEARLGTKPLSPADPPDRHWSLWLVLIGVLFTATVAWAGP